MYTGRIVRKTSRGFGFIQQVNGGDIFFHAKALRNRTWETVAEGDVVEFDIEDAEKGPRAENVRVI